MLIISCIICTYNRDRYLAKALDSLLHQSLPPSLYEIILVDNASTDTTAEIARHYQSTPHFSYIYEARQGLSIARNRGISAAKGQYIAFLDDDAIAAPHWLSQMIQVFSEYSDVVALGGKIDLIWELPPPDWLTKGMQAFFAKLDISDKPIYLDPPLHVYGCNMAFRKEALQAIGGFNEKLGITGEKMLTSEEILVQDILRKKGGRIFYDPAIAVQHHVQPEKMTQEWFLKRFMGQGESIAQMEMLTEGLNDKKKLNRVLKAIEEIELIADRNSSQTFQQKANIMMKAGYLTHMLSMENQNPSPKKVLLLTHGTYLNKEFVVSGNSVRAYYLAKGFIENGMEVTHVYPLELAKFSTETDLLPNLSIRTYQGASSLASLIQEEAPDAILVGYWELLRDLPADIELPVMLDVSTPRILEQIYQGGNLQDEIGLMLQLYPKADLFLAGNQKQAHFLLPWLIMAGFDCSKKIPVEIFPLSAEAGEARRFTGNRWEIVSGGVSSAWRKSEAYFDQVLDFIQSHPQYPAHLSILKGKYIYARGKETLSTQGKHFSERGLMTYQEMETFFSQSCHIGLELCEKNIEREYSQSFRAIEYLRHGIPIICNDFLELAEYIKAFDAGWVISSPEDIPEVLENIFSQPELYAQKSQNALRLLSEHFNYALNITPFVDFVHTGKKAERLANPMFWKTNMPQEIAGKIGAVVFSDWSN